MQGFLTCKFEGRGSPAAVGALETWTSLVLPALSAKEMLQEGGFEMPIASKSTLEVIQAGEVV